MIEKKTILISGATGLVGRSLCEVLQARGHSVRRLSRGAGGDYQWNVSAGQLDQAALQGVDVVIHLAGETVAQRWTRAAKARILRSRVDGTRLLVDAILRQAKRPALIAASGISYYGITRTDSVDESALTGDGFLAEVTRQWEGAAQPLIDAGGRVAFLRTGIVLSRQGGALAKMLPAFKCGLGGRIASGQQWMSWIGLPDLVNAYLLAVENDAVAGPINAVAPAAVSNLQFTKTLGCVLGRPTCFPLPRVVVNTLFGEMGRETLLSDLSVLPRRLEELGFVWQTPSLAATLREAIYGD